MTDWSRLAGMTCTCPPNCTDKAWGDGPRACDPNCRPCQIMAGTVYSPPDERKKS